MDGQQKMPPQVQFATFILIAALVMAALWLASQGGPWTYGVRR